MKDFLNQPHYRDLGQGNLQAMLKIAKRLKHPRLEDVEDELANRESAKHDKQAEKARAKSASSSPHEKHRDHEGEMDEASAYHQDRHKELKGLASEEEGKGNSERAADLRIAARHHEGAMHAHDEYLDHVRNADLNDPKERQRADDLHQNAKEQGERAEKEAERVAEKHAAPASESKHHEPVPKPKEKTEHELRSEATEASKKGDFNTRDKLDSMADKAKESKNLETGARGGRFYVNSAGKKVYVK